MVNASRALQVQSQLKVNASRALQVQSGLTVSASRVLQVKAWLMVNASHALPVQSSLMVNASSAPQIKSRVMANAYRVVKLQSQLLVNASRARWFAVNACRIERPRLLVISTRTKALCNGISILSPGCDPVYPHLPPLAIFFASISIPKTRLEFRLQYLDSSAANQSASVRSTSAPKTGASAECPAHDGRARRYVRRILSCATNR